MAATNPILSSQLWDRPATELADLVLAVLVRTRATALAIKEELGPGAGTYGVYLQRGSAAPLAVLRLPQSIGEATVARLTLLAALDVAAGADLAGGQLGRVKIKLDGFTADVLVDVRTSPEGRVVELRRIAGFEGAVGAVGAAGVVGAAGADLPAGDQDRISIYRVQGELGRGGMGVVYRGVHEALARPIAIKVLYATYARDPEVAARFVREGRAAGRIRHPGIVDVHDFGMLADGRAFLVMELVELPTLDALIAKGPIDPLRALVIARNIADALSAAHSAGVVHRDLKPSNIFVDPEGRVKLADFGAAKLVGGGGGPAETQPGSVFGTPYYMSPEHARGLSTDGRTDVYGLGCVLHEMITGEVPFDGETSIDVLTKHINGKIPSLTCAAGPLPEQVQHVVTRALAKRPSDRYQSACEMIDDIDRATASLGKPSWFRWLAL